MLTSDSRYRDTTLFQRRSDGSIVFPGIRSRPIGPAEGVIEHALRAGDRLDLLAQHYYNDDRLWWRILDANPQLLFGWPLLPVVGITPTDNSGGQASDNPDDDNPVQPPNLVGEIILIPRAQEEF